MAQSLEQTMQQERARLATRRNEIVERQRAVQQELDQIERDLLAIDAWERARKGQLAIEPKAPRQRREGRGKREELLKYIRENFEAGVTRAELLSAMDIDEKDEEGKRRAQSVSNALSVLTKSNQLVRDGRTYKLPTG